MTLILFAAITALVVFLPGFVVLAASRDGRDLPMMLAASVPLSAGMYYVSALWLSLVHVHVLWALLIPSLAVVPATFSVVRRRRQGEVLPADAEQPWSLLACLAGSVTIVVVFLAGMGAFDRVPTHDDGFNHGYFAARILATATIDPSVVLTLDAETTEQAISFYPMVTHLQAAIISWVSGVDVAVSFTSVVVFGLAIALPSGMLLLTRHLFPSTRWAGPVAALFAAAVPGLSYSATWGGMFPSVLGIAAVPGVAVLAYRWAHRPTAPGLVLVSLGLAGLFGIHSSAAAFAVLVALVLTTATGGALSWGRRLGAGLAWGACTAVLLGPALLDLAGGWSERRSTDQSFDMSVFEGVFQVVVLRDYASGPSPLALAILGWGGLAYCLATGAARSWAWMTLALAVVCVALSFWRSPVLLLLTSPWYASSARFATMFIFAMVPIAAFCVVTAARRFARDWVGALIRVMIVGLGMALVADGVVQAGRIVQTNYDDYSTVDDHDRRAYTWLANHVEPGERVLNGQADGSQWMYALAGVVPVSSTKAVEGHEDDDRERLAREVASVGTDPVVDKIMTKLNVRYAFVGDDQFRDRDNVLELEALQSSAFWTQVFSSGGVRVFEATLPSSAEPRP